MKANRKFKNEEEAVSAVIGVILMVAITVAIAATVYVYVSGMLSGGPTKTPDIAFVMDDVANTLTVTKVSRSDVPWIYIQIGSSTCVKPSSGNVTAGDVVTGCYGTVTLSYLGTTLLGSWTFSAT